jgi:hypothetical protein
MLQLYLQKSIPLDRIYAADNFAILKEFFFYLQRSSEILYSEELTNSSNDIHTAATPHRGDISCDNNTKRSRFTTTVVEEESTFYIENRCSDKCDINKTRAVDVLTATLLQPENCACSHFDGDNILGTSSAAEPASDEPDECFLSIVSDSIAERHSLYNIDSGSIGTGGHCHCHVINMAKRALYHMDEQVTGPRHCLQYMTLFFFISPERDSVTR